MTAATTPRPFSDSIRQARAAVLERVPAPDLLCLFATGVGVLPDRLEHHESLVLGEVEGVPPDWQGTRLHAGVLGELAVWMLDDENVQLGESPTWSGGFPVWLAAASGAECLVHASAGCALPGFEPQSGLIATEDHLRVGDRNPLVGLGTNDLGPLFPDLSLLHDAELRSCAAQHAKELGFELETALVACMPGPALETPAERRMLVSMGASVSVQSLAAPLLAAGHAGLRVLSLIAVTDNGERPVDLTAQLNVAENLAPKLDDLVIALIPDISKRVATLRAEKTA